MEDSLKRIRVIILEHNSENKIRFDYIGGKWKKYINENIVSYGDNYKYKYFLKEIVFNNCKIEELAYLKICPLLD